MYMSWLLMPIGFLYASSVIIKHMLFFIAVCYSLIILLYYFYYFRTIFCISYYCDSYAIRAIDELFVKKHSYQVRKKRKKRILCASTWYFLVSRVALYMDLVKKLYVRMGLSFCSINFWKVVEYNLVFLGIYHVYASLIPFLVCVKSY